MTDSESLEGLIQRASNIPSFVSEEDFAEHLMDEGVPADTAFLVVVAGRILAARDEDDYL